LVDEPVASDSIKAGADLVLFSGDKLLGGPQCGIIVGSKKWVQLILRHPLMRALRVDKCTLAGLAATLRLYLNPDHALQKIPILSLLSTSQENLQNRAERLAAQMKGAAGIAAAEPLVDTSPLGGGSVPAQELPTWCIGLTPKSGSVDQMAKALRNGTPSVVGRIKNDRLMLDLRTVRPSEDVVLVQVVTSYGATSASCQATENG
jgi:L-seryl-tRNA(Ser) seleniumtransferase